MTNAEAYKWLYVHFAPCGDETKQDAAVTKALEALKKQILQEWIPCKPLELPKDKKLWVTHNAFGYRYVTRIFWDMTGWNDNVSDVVAYMPYVEPEPYREE